MTFISDDRGVSEVIGAVLVFGLLIALLAIMQSQAVPAANKQVEFNHNQDVQSDMVGLQESASRVSAQGAPESTKIQMGTSYPNRMIFFNPPSPGGTLRTVETTDAEIRNVNATDRTIRKYIDGDISGLEASRVEYQPKYNEYRNPPTTVLEYGTLYSDFGDQQQINDPGSIIDGNTISLTFFAGEMSQTTSSTMSLKARPTSAPVRTVNVEPKTAGANVTIRLATRLSEAKWNQLLGDEPNVEGIRHDGDVVKIDLNGSTTYSVQMARIGVGNNAESPEPQYIVPTGGLGPSTVGIRSNSLPFEVRDRYNNPASGETVNITVNKGDFANGNQRTSATTNIEGRPNVRYTASSAGLVTVNASFDGYPDDLTYDFDPDTDPADLQFKMDVDPSQDTQNPVINIGSSDVTRRDYSVCGGSGLIGGLACTLGASTLQYSQITVDYDLEDNGVAGLEAMKIEVFNGTGAVRMTDELGVTGSTASGLYQSPQIFINDGLFNDNLPETLEITVADKAGNTASETYNVDNVS